MKVWIARDTTTSMRTDLLIYMREPNLGSDGLWTAPTLTALIGAIPIRHAKATGDPIPKPGKCIAGELTVKFKIAREKT